ncbi:MAG: hypothetical protein QME75_00325 [Deltaproteobacteria bacterium]|nr:hypothetical protein [Deltaproteobacteria bacterium]
MPYIAGDRKELDGLIDRLAETIARRAGEGDSAAAFAGLLNYVCTRLALKVVRLKFGAMRYWLIAVVTGVFTNIADEFYRRVAVPYENKQLARHGDIDLYEEFGREISRK